MSRCRSCEAEIIWAITASGKRIPLDAETVDDPRGKFTLEEVDGETHARAAKPTYISHFATCPFATQHRKRS